MRHVYFAMLSERSILAEAKEAFDRLCFRLGSQPTALVEYHLLQNGYERTDSARNHLCFNFMKQAVSDDDTIIMLDDDHNHPVDLVERLTAHNKPIVGALAFKRLPPYNPVAYIKDKDGQSKIPVQWEQTLCQVDAVGFGAVAIQKKVFDTITKRGFAWPWFRFQYSDWQLYHYGEDIGFCKVANKCGLPIYCDFGLVTPHLGLEGRVAADWQQWLNEHPDRLLGAEDLGKVIIDQIPERYYDRKAG